jgi:ribosomal protein S18 acetylase RimI-like enzyme
MTDRAYRIGTAESVTDLADVRVLFRDYAAWLALDLSFQGFEQELAGLPGAYAPPLGALLVARAATGQALGCVAMRPFRPPFECELKRLYVSPAGRGHLLGQALVSAIVRSAERAGYSKILLDTLPEMSAARAIYAAAGFQTVPPYYDTPLAGTIFMAKDLGD